MRQTIFGQSEYIRYLKFGIREQLLSIHSKIDEVYCKKKSLLTRILLDLESIHTFGYAHFTKVVKAIHFTQNVDI